MMKNHTVNERAWRDIAKRHPMPAAVGASVGDDEQWAALRADANEVWRAFWRAHADGFDGGFKEFRAVWFTVARGPHGRGQA